VTGKQTTGPAARPESERPDSEHAARDRRRARRRALKTGAALAALVLPVASACGIQPTGIVNLGPAPAASGAAAQQSLAQTGSSQYSLFFYQDGRITQVVRTGTDMPSEESILAAMIKGPTTKEAALGYTSALPSDLVVKTRAAGFADAYLVTAALNTKAKAQFVCTMQYWDQTISVGLQTVGADKPTWLACSNTVNYYIPMPGDGGTAAGLPSN
jgi:hypothetical protein